MCPTMATAIPPTSRSTKGVGLAPKSGCGKSSGEKLASQHQGAIAGEYPGPPLHNALTMPVEPQSVEEIAEGLRGVGYLPGDSTALVAFLAAKLGKPVLVEGPAGVGKTELAKALHRYLDRALVRLQCYEGLDEAKSLYEWNYRKQLLRIQAEERGAGWEAVQEDIFSEDFLHAPDLSDTVGRKLVELIQQVRALDLKKPPSIAESIDWARALLLLGADDIDADVFRETMSIIVKHRTDLDTVAERVGVKLSDVNAPL